ncbi:unnamed protein product [Colias eurytheme]|nr:unnamed protein product [Colias eurytheme]
MYRIFLFTLFILAESKWQKPSNGYKKPAKPETPNEVMARIVDKLRAADELVRNKYVKYNATEKYDTKGYILKYKMQHDLVNFINIKITNNVIHINVKLEYGLNYNDVRILPGGVETRDAIWLIEEDNLIITMPYKVERGSESQLTCKAVKDTLVDVPLSTELSVYEFFYRNIGTPSQ